MEECFCMKLVTLVLLGSIWVKNGWGPYNAKVTNYMKNNVSQEEEGMKGKPVNIGSLSHCRKFRRILHYLLFLQFICIVTDFQTAFKGMVQHAAHLLLCQKLGLVSLITGCLFCLPLKV